MLNRQLHPDYKAIEQINIPVPEKVALDNHLKTFLFNAGTQDVLKIDLSFEAGSWHQEKPLVASLVNEMLTEGSKNYTSQQIAEKLDFYGAFIHPSPTKDFGSITLYTLSKHLPETIRVFEDVIKNPLFPEKDLRIHLNKRKQQFLIELEKVTNIARREFNEQLFGSQHPYGRKSEASDYDQLERQDLINFHKKYYHPANCKLIVSGKTDERIIKIINKHLGNNDWQNQQALNSLEYPIPDSPKLVSIVEKEHVTQSAIRLGKITINKDHPDFHKLKITNTILGGYFGSRLMKKIREEKGYTYGIGSNIVTMKNAAFLIIVSEVGKDVTRNAIDDIMNEINILRNSYVSADEMALVKNYMLGSLLRAFDGAFEISSTYRSLIDFDLDENYLHEAIRTIKTISPEEIHQMANQYINEESLIKTVAGKYN